MQEEQRSAAYPSRRRERKQAQESAAKEKEPSESKGRRAFPWWMKLGLAAVLLFLSLVGGLITGYSIKSTGAIHEVFDPNTYIHMYNLVFKAE